MNKVNIFIGDRIYTLRNKQGLAQMELAKKLGVSRASIANYESGKQRIQTDDLYRVAQLFNVTPFYLLPEVEPTDEEIKSILSKREKKTCECCGQRIKESPCRR